VAVVCAGLHFFLQYPVLYGRVVNIVRVLNYRFSLCVREGAEKQYCRVTGGERAVACSDELSPLLAASPATAAKNVFAAMRNDKIVAVSPYKQPKKVTTLSGGRPRRSSKYVVFKRVGALSHLISPRRQRDRDCERHPLEKENARSHNGAPQGLSAIALYRVL